MNIFLQIEIMSDLMDATLFIVKIMIKLINTELEGLML